MGRRHERAAGRTAGKNGPQPGVIATHFPVVSLARSADTSLFPKTLLKFLLKLAVSSGLLALLIAHADMGALQVALARVGWRDLFAVTMILLGLVPVLAWRWRGIARTIC